MSTLSVPLPEDMIRHIKSLVKQGIAPNMSELVRKALQHYLEDQAVQAVQKADKEPSLHGDLDDLAGKII